VERRRFCPRKILEVGALACGSTLTFTDFLGVP
jgi:hypothetical protein